MIPFLAVPLLVQPAASSSQIEIQPGLFVLPGNPGDTTLGVLRALGITHVINLRHPSEGDFSREISRVSHSGAAYFNLPFDRRPSLIQLDSFRAQMSSLPPEAKVLVHCASGNRAGAALLAYWILDKAVPEEDAFRLARQAGLSHPETEAAVKVYLDGHSPHVGSSRFSGEASK
jgi:protein tyrosine phosphatase (PTP) superfamily phosphohydrolase (DUF442 family)